MKKIHPYIYAGLTKTPYTKPIYSIGNLYKAIKIALDVDETEIANNRRFQSVTYARHIFHYMCVKELNLSLVETGRLSNKNHATVIHSCNVIKDLVFSDYKNPTMIHKFGAVRDEMINIRGERERNYESI